MKLEQRLKRIIDRCFYSKGNDHKRARKQFLQKALKVVEKRDIETLPPGLHKSFSELIDNLHESADFLDAAAYVEELVLNAQNGSISNIQTRSNQRYDFYQNEIRRLFDSKGIRFRSYVYVLWRAKRPSQFLYIGKATDETRLLGPSHVKLGASLPLCTNISLVFPGKSEKENISNLEASLIRLVEFETGKLPVNNTRDEKLKSHYASNSVKSLSVFLGKLGKELDPFS